MGLGRAGSFVWPKYRPSGCGFGPRHRRRAVRFLAEEDEFDRRTLWRLGSWGVASVGAIVLALIVNQSSIGSRREQVAAADLARQAQQQIQSVAKESHSEARRLASAIETLNGDRDRLYTRVTVLEQGLDSVTGSIARQNTATAPQVPAWPVAETAAVPVGPPPVVAPVATTAAAVIDKPRTTAAASSRHQPRSRPLPGKRQISRQQALQRR
jgi:hypothetical protein